MALPSESYTSTFVDDAGISLASLAPGRSATVLDVDASTSAGQRLLELGFLPETEIRVVRRAPLGDPTAFYLRGSQICLRRSVAALVRVLANDPASEA
jgi:ferrous iron transport protein A